MWTNIIFRIQMLLIIYLEICLLEQKCQVISFNIFFFWNTMFAWICGFKWMMFIIMDDVTNANLCLKIILGMYSHDEYICNGSFEIEHKATQTMQYVNIIYTKIYSLFTKCNVLFHPFGTWEWVVVGEGRYFCITIYAYK